MVFMDKKVRKSTSIVSGVLISTSLINNAVSLASVGPAVKTGVQMLGNGAVSLLNGTKDNILLPFVRGVISSIALPALLFFCVYGFYYNKCVLHTDRGVYRFIGSIVSFPDAVYSFIRGFFPDKEEIDANNKKQEEVEVIPINDLRVKVGDIENSFAEIVSEVDWVKKIGKKIDDLEKRLEATRGSLSYKLNWAKFLLGAPFCSETRKQYAGLASYLKDMRKGLDSIEGIVKEWKKIKESKENKLSLLLLEESKGKENALIDLLGEIERLGEGENTFLKQYSQNFFKEYIEELKKEVFKEFKRIVKKEKEEGGEEAFNSLISKLDAFNQETKGRFSGEVKKLSDFLSSSHKLLLVEKQAQGILKECGLGCSRDLEKLLNFVFGKGWLGILGDFFEGLLDADDNINKPKKELKDEDLLTILEKIGSKKSVLMTLKGAITSAINELREIGENDLSKSILGKAEKTKKMLGSLFEKKGVDGKDLMSVAEEYAECCKEVKEIKEKKFNNEGKKKLNAVFTLLESFYEGKLKDLDNLLTKISTFEGKCNKDFVDCLKSTVLKLKTRYDGTKTTLNNFAVKVVNFSSLFESNKKINLDNIAKKLFVEKNRDIGFILDSLESSFKKEVCVLKFGEIEEVKGFWEDWKKSFISKYRDEVNKKVEALEKEAKEKEEQEKKDVDLIEKTKEAINSFKLEKDYKSKIDLLKKQLSEVSTQNNVVSDLFVKLNSLIYFCEITLREGMLLSERIELLANSIEELQECPTLFESAVTYLSEQFDLSARKGYDKDFYELFLNLTSLQGKLNNGEENKQIRELVKSFYEKVKDVVVKEAEDSLNDKGKFTSNFGEGNFEVLYCYSEIKKFAKKVIGTKQNLIKSKAELLHYFLSTSESVNESPLFSQIKIIKEDLENIYKKVKEDFKNNINLNEFLLAYFNSEKKEEDDYPEYFLIGLKDLDLDFVGRSNVRKFFVIGNSKNTYLLKDIGRLLNRIQKYGLFDDAGNSTLEKLFQDLSLLNGDEKIVPDIKSAVATKLCCLSNIIVSRFNKEKTLGFLKDISLKNFIKLFEFIDETKTIDNLSDRERKRLWFLLLFGTFYNSKGILGNDNETWFNLVKKSKFIEEDNVKGFIAKIFCSFSGLKPSEDLTLYSENEVKKVLDGFFEDDRDFSNFAFSLFESCKKEFHLEDVINDTLNTVSDLAEKGFNMFGDVTKNFFGNLWG